MKKCDGTAKLTDVKPTYKVVIDWNGSKKYQCEFCGKEFGDLDNFHQHFWQYQRTMQIKNKDVVYKEINDKDGRKAYQCLKCVGVFESNAKIMKHFYQVHRERKHKCDKCNKSYSFLFILKKHLKSCTRSKTVECENKSKEGQITGKSLSSEAQNVHTENVDIISESVKSEFAKQEQDPLEIDPNEFTENSDSLTLEPQLIFS